MPARSTSLAMVRIATGVHRHYRVLRLPEPGGLTKVRNALGLENTAIAVIGRRHAMKLVEALIELRGDSLMLL